MVCGVAQCYAEILDRSVFPNPLKRTAAPLSTPRPSNKAITSVKGKGMPLRGWAASFKGSREFRV